MKLLDPQLVTDATLDYSSVIEVPPPAWNSGTTYDDGDLVSQGTVGQVITCYKSIADGNTGNPPTTGAEGDFSSDFSADFNTTGGWWVWAGDTYAAWSVATTYAKGDKILVESTHLVYESMQGGNTGHDPVPDTTSTWWLPLGATNQWAMFDQYIGEFTVAPAPIVVVITPAEAFNSLSLLDIVANLVRVVVDHLGTIYYDQTKYMKDGRNTMGWWEYYFMPLDPQKSILFENLPPTGTITITVDGTQVGTVLVGTMMTIGETSQGPDIGIVDYSKREVDDFGNSYIIERGFAKRYSISSIIEAGRIDYIADVLSSVRAQPVLWIADETYRWTSLVVYGFYKDWDIQFINPSHAQCNITIEGLVQ